MKKYTIEIDDDLSTLFESIAQAAGRTVEDVLSDTPYKIVDVILKSIEEK